MKSVTNILKEALEEGVSKRVFPGAAGCIAVKGDLLACEHAGMAAWEPEPEPLQPGMLFDVASLTKVMVTTPIAMKLVAEGMLELDRSVSEVLPDADSLAGITPRHLLSHCSGLPFWLPFFKMYQGDRQLFRRQLFERLRQMKPDVPPGTREMYSDVGFFVLMDVLQEVSGNTFKQLVKEYLLNTLNINDIVCAEDLKDHVKEEGRMVVPTERCPWRKRILRGEVHDDNAWAWGGVAAHAGLFATAEAVARSGITAIDFYQGKQVGDLSIPMELVKEFYKRAGIVPGSDRCLGWDSPRPDGSSSGKHFSMHSIGHLGFTGTSLWIDLEREIVVVLLSNRVHPSQKNVAIREFRPWFHDMVMEDLIG